MAWDGQDRRSGKDQRQGERRNRRSQTVSQLAESADRRRRGRRSEDPPVTPARPGGADKWRGLRLRTVGKDTKKRPAGERPDFRLIRGGDVDQD